MSSRARHTIHRAGVSRTTRHTLHPFFNVHCQTPATLRQFHRALPRAAAAAAGGAGAGQVLVEEFGGKVPDTMEALITLPGVARKTANVLLGTAFKKAVGVVVDTHVIRLSTRMALTKHKDPKKIEQDLMALVPKTRWTRFSHQMILHGRTICKAKAPQCNVCTLGPTLCPSYQRQ